jgi:hypothetical protein
MDGAGEFLFFYEQVGDKKSAKHKEEIDAQVSMPAYKFYHLVNSGLCVGEITEDRQMRMVKKHDKKRYKTKSIQVRKKYLRLGGRRFLLHFCSLIFFYYLGID